MSNSTDYHKIKLFEYISNLELSFHEKIIFDQEYFNLYYNLEILLDKKLKIYINYLYEKYNNFEKLNYIDKVHLIKNAQIREALIEGKSNLDNNINNQLAVDLVLLKEIQLEKENSNIKNNLTMQSFS